MRLRLDRIATLLIGFCLGGGGGARSMAGAQQNVPRQAWSHQAWSHQAWSTEQGLPQNSVHAILQTRDGFLWLATEGGAARFDGVSFTVYRHINESAFTSDDLCCLAEERGSGALWIGTSDGLVRLQAGRFTHFGAGDGLPSPTVLSLTADGDDGVLVRTASGVVRARNGRLAPAPNEPMANVPAIVAPVLGAATASDGTLWVRLANSIVHTDAHRNHIWTAGRELPGVRVESLSVDHAARAWVGTNAGLVTLQAGAPAAEPVPALGANAILSTYEDREGNLWVGTESSGLHVLRRLKFRAEPALADLTLTSATQAIDGAVWVGTRDDGLRRLLDRRADTPIAAERLTSPVILALAPGPDASLWVGTPDGLNHILRGGKVEPITAANGLPDEFVRVLFPEPDGSVWIGTRRGLAHLRGSVLTTLTRADRLGGDGIGALLRTSAHPGNTQPAGLWVGTSGGLSLLRAGEPIETLTMADGLPDAIVTALTEDATGTLWVGTRGGGLSRWHAGRFVAVARPEPDEIAALALDAGGALWMRSARGVERAPAAAVRECTAGTSACPGLFARFGVSDGLPSEELVAGTSPAIFATRAGELLFPTRRGLAIADPAQLPFNSVPPPIAFERMLVDDAPIDLASAQAGAAPLRLPFGRSRLTIDYAALSFVIPAAVRYRVLLAGFDPAWIDAGARRSATYTNLPPGRYTFRVEARNNDGVWNRTGAQLAFEIVPPFYRRWWFYVLTALLALALAAGIYLLRVERLRGEFALVLGERNRMAREIHDTLAQDFVGVSLQLDLVAEMLKREQVEAALGQVSRTRRLVTDGLAEARRSIWELRANTATDSLPTRLAETAKRFRSDTRALRLAIGGAYRALTPDREAEILRITGEALTNVDRHARATEITVELRYAGEEVVLTVIDNGAGFDPAQTADGRYGMAGMRERAALLGARLNVTSAVGGGTRVELIVPAPPVSSSDTRRRSA